MRHLTDLFKGLAAVTLTAVALIAVPIGLATYVGWPLPTTIPSVEEIQLALRSGIDPQLLTNTLAVIVWIVWAQLVVVFAAETVAAVRGTAARRLPVFPGLQPAVAQLVAVVTLAVATLGPLRAVPVAAAPLPATVMAPVYTTLQLDNQQLGFPKPATAPSPEPAARSPESSYRVERFDTLWSIADATLGDGRRWTEIRDLNIGRVMADGHRITATTDRLTPGWLLILPQDAQPPQHVDNPQDQVAGEVTVKDGDNFWTIAEEALHTASGRPPSDVETAEYWRRLVDTNRHRLAPPHDPNLIYPDQRFELPPIPAAPQTGEPTSTASPAASDPREHVEVVVEPGDSFWSITEHALTETWGRSPTSAETVDYFNQVVDVNRDRLLPPHDPNLIHPDQILHLPPIPDDPHTPVDPDLGDDTPPPEPSGEPPTEAVAASEIPPVEDPFTASRLGTVGWSHVLDRLTPRQHPAETLAPTETTRAQQPPHRTELAAAAQGGSDADDRNVAAELFPIASSLAGLGILAAGLVALIHRLRNTQLRQRRPGTIPTPPPTGTAETEATIRTAAAPTSTDLINLALRAVASEVVRSDLPPPEVVGVHLDADTLRLLLWTPHHHPPQGWRIDDDGRSWTLPTGTDIDQLRGHAQGVPAPYPALVTVGHTDRTQLLLDLEYLGATQITGDPDDVAATCYTMATELAASAIADDLHIVCVGFGHDLAHHERIQAVDRLDDALPAIEAKAAALTHHESASPLQDRLSPGGDSWHPIIVFDPAADPPGQARRLLDAAHPGRAVAAVVGYPTGGRWGLHVEDNTIRIDPLGYTYHRRNLTPTEQTAVAGLVAAANDLDGTRTGHAAEPDPLHKQIDPAPSVDESAAPDGPEDTDIDTSDPDTFSNPEAKTLGTLRIAGLDARFPLRKCTELVTYLTFHRNGVEADTLMEALWPQQPPDNERLNRHTSRARVTLGAGPDGELYLPHITDSIYRIGPHLHSDYDRFTHHSHQADRASRSEEKIEHLRAALGLVEGAPFTGAGNGYTWAHTDGTITHTIVTIDDTAHRLALIALHNGTPDLATWAARKGLTATGACEQCYRNLMRAADAEGNQVALEAVFKELLAVVDADEGPDASTILDPETVELYEQQTRRRRHPG